jgi:hypothetical protein
LVGAGLIVFRGVLGRRFGPRFIAALEVGDGVVRPQSDMARAIRLAARFFGIAGVVAILMGISVSIIGLAATG